MRCGQAEQPADAGEQRAAAGRDRELRRMSAQFLQRRQRPRVFEAVAADGVPQVPRTSGTLSPDQSLPPGKGVGGNSSGIRITVVL